MRAHTKALIAASAVTYLGGAFLTFGYAYNLPMTQVCGLVDPTYCTDSPTVHSGTAVIAGVSWPVYWAGNLAIDFTRPTQSTLTDGEGVE